MAPTVYERKMNVGDLRFDNNNIDSYESIAENINRPNFFKWTGLSHSVRFNLRNLGPVRTDISPSIKIDNALFDVIKEKPKDCSSLLVFKKHAFRITHKT